MQPSNTSATSVFTPTPNAITQDEWVKRYWFDNLQMVTVLNPSWYRGESGSDDPISADFPFMVEMRHFIVKAGKSESLPGSIANVYLDQMSRLLAQNDDKLSFIGDPQLKKIYYDKLIVEVKSLVPQYDSTPAYLRNISPNVVGKAPDEIAPWESNMERARVVTPDVPPTPPVHESQVEQSPISESTSSQKPDEPEEHNFEYEGNKYRMVKASGKNNHRMFYKNGIMISNAEFNKAASMI